MSNTKQVDPAAAAELFIIHDQVHEPMHDRFLWATMQRRDAEAAAIPEWEELRELASKIRSIRSLTLTTTWKSSRRMPQNVARMSTGQSMPPSTMRLCIPSSRTME